MVIEIVSFPIHSMVISNSYVNVYQAGYMFDLVRWNIMEHHAEHRRSVLGSKGTKVMAAMDFKLFSLSWVRVKTLVTGTLYGN